MSKFAKLEVLVYNKDQKALIDAGCEIEEPYNTYHREFRLINLNQITDVGPDTKEPNYMVIDMSNCDSFIVPMTMDEFEIKFLVKGETLL